MTINLRGRDPELRLAQAAAQTGDVETALGHLKSSTIETSGDSALTAAEQWLQLAPLERERTAIYASGRALRTAVNEAVQRGLKANGELGKTSLDLTRSEEHTSELQSLMRISYAVFCLQKKKQKQTI